MKLIPEIWRREFSFKKFSLKHGKYVDFYTSQWQKNNTINIIYMVYRIAIALIFFVTLILSIIDLNHLDEPFVSKLKWLIYLTHWGYAVCTIQAFLSAYMVLSMYRKVRKSDEPINNDNTSPKLCAVYWVLFTIATDAAFAITCIYWSLIFNPKQHPVDAMNIFVHGINSLLMLIDLFIVAHPIRLLHCYWSFLFAVLYIIFNIVYYLAGGTDKRGQHYIYAILDWQHPLNSLLTAFLALTFLIFLHLFTYCMFLLRTHIRNNIYKYKNDDNEFAMHVSSIQFSNGDKNKNSSNHEHSQHI